MRAFSCGGRGGRRRPFNGSHAHSSAGQQTCQHISRVGMDRNYVFTYHRTERDHNPTGINTFHGIGNDAIPTGMHFRE
jgi:hypothetical protein